MHIKKITANDSLLVISLFDKYRMFYMQASDILLAERFIKERLENNESVIFVALDDDSTPMGFTQLYPLISSVRAVKNWLLNDLYVDEEFRRQGIGEALIQTAMAFAKSENSAYIQLETAADNTIAQSLYESIGFEKQAHSNAFYVYQKNLT